ncbi:MAG: hypothetical protein WCF57_08385 [Pyrinomonadaceae bacterium]
MPVVKKRNEQTETRLLLESDGPVELPPATIEDGDVIAQFEAHKPHVPELLEALRAGTVAEPVPVMLDGSTFVIHGATRTFWVKLWHAAKSDMSRIERAQVISCLPSTRGAQIVIADYDDDYETDDDDDEFDEDTGDDSFTDSQR